VPDSAVELKDNDSLFRKCRKGYLDKYSESWTQTCIVISNCRGLHAWRIVYPLAENGKGCQHTKKGRVRPARVPGHCAQHEKHTIVLPKVEPSEQRKQRGQASNQCCCIRRSVLSLCAAPARSGAVVEVLIGFLFCAVLLTRQWPFYDTWNSSDATFAFW
jgi:hypothetical protein